ncbi:ABC transporter substrate-binding protein [Cryobacterium sp. N19]|uniref:ABC transporter substrate-binding protein n=1 Tax=Cryobacterium sp. N19 TaxID=2048288 RepID=UPI000CE3B448|nr:ABC transporter substrate-binding protein [Cryobacterium sp. N19]
MKTARKLTVGAAMLLAIGLAGCAVDEGGTGGPSAASSAGPQELNQKLHDALPEAIQESGKIIAVNNGSFPPYTVVEGDGTLNGATADISVAIGEILGVTIEHSTVDGLASVLSGMDAGRYDLNVGPTGDFKERQEQATFIDWVQEFVVFAVAAGNPQKISDLDSTCGKKIAVMASGSAEKVIKTQADKCVADGEPALEVQSYKDQPSSILAVQSGRADGFFSSQAPLTYFVEQSDGALELAATGEKNGFTDLHQGALVPRDSPLADIMLAAFQELFDNGTYAEIMKAHGLEGNMVEAPGINLGVS